MSTVPYIIVALDPRPCRFCGEIIQPGSHQGKKVTCDADVCQAKAKDRELALGAEAVRRHRRGQYKAKDVPKHHNPWRRKVRRCIECGKRKVCIWTGLCLSCKARKERTYDMDAGFFDTSGKQPWSERSEL